MIRCCVLFTRILHIWTFGALLKLRNVIWLFVLKWCLKKRTLSIHSIELVLVGLGWPKAFEYLVPITSGDVLIIGWIPVKLISCIFNWWLVLNVDILNISDNVHVVVRHRWRHSITCKIVLCCLKVLIIQIIILLAHLILIWVIEIVIWFSALFCIIMHAARLLLRRAESKKSGRIQVAMVAISYLPSFDLFDCLVIFLLKELVKMYWSIWKLLLRHVDLW